MNVEHGLRPEAPRTTGGKKARFDREAVNDQVQELKEREKKGRVLELYQPEALAAGGVNAVFEVAEHPNIVAKVSMLAVEKTLANNEAQGIAPGELTETRRAELLAEVQTEKQRLSTLKKYFPKYTLAERFYLQEVPVTKDLLETATGHASENRQLGDDVIEIASIVRIQEKIPSEVLESEETMDLAFGYREDDKKLTLKDYSKWNQDLLGGQGEYAAEYIASIERAGQPSDLAQLLELMQNDESLRSMMKEFVQSALDYTKNEGEMLDIFGARNILVHKDKANKWTMTFADALYPKKAAWQHCKKAVRGSFYAWEKTPDQNRDSKEYGNHTDAYVNAINYVRDLNALAAVTGVEDRLTLPVSSIAESSQMMYKEFRRHRKVENVARKELPGKTPDAMLPRLDTDDIEHTLVMDVEDALDEFSTDVFDEEEKVA